MGTGYWSGPYFSPHKAAKEWEGPFTVTKVLGPVTYEVCCGPCQNQLKVLHINHLKFWHDPDPPKTTIAWSDTCPLPISAREFPWISHIEGSFAREKPPLVLNRTSLQKQDIEDTLDRFPTLFSSTPGPTTALWHVIDTPLWHVVRITLQPISWKQWDMVNQDVASMLRMNIIKPSTSAWISPIALVPKPDNTICFCIDFWEVYKIAAFDAYPMPRTDVPLSHLGKTHYVSALDLMKGYCQVPLQPQDQKKTAFATLRGLFQFKVMPFGLHGAAATFQRLVDTVLSPCEGYTLVYLDDILIYSRTWNQHLIHFTQVFQ